MVNQNEITMTEKNLYKNEPEPVREGQPSRSTENHGSTTQGGSNFGQGSHQLGKAAEEQGSKTGEGSNYEDEGGWNNEALRNEDEPERQKD